MGSQPSELKRRCVICHTIYVTERFCPLDAGAVIVDTAPTANPDPLIGQTVDDRYLVRRVLGRGGMGVVYEADHVGLDKRVAIKFVSHANSDRDVRARFRQEARAASKVVHEHVVQILDVGDHEERDYLVMELLEGHDLQALLVDGPLSAKRAVAIARQVLGGLQAIHNAGFVHRDIKPANVVLLDPVDGRGTDVVKITDFGIAKAIEKGIGQVETGTGKIIGTPQFMAPEHLLDSKVDHRADQYSVGVMLFVMLTGKLPFQGTSASRMGEFMAVPAPRVDLLQPGLAPALVAAVARALEKHPANRFPDARAFADALERVVSDRGAAPPSGSASTVLARASDRERLADREVATVPLRPSRLSHVDSPALANVERTRRWRPLAIAGLAGAVALGAVAFWIARSTSSSNVILALADGSISHALPPDADLLERARSAELAGELPRAIVAYEDAYAATHAVELLFRIGDLYERASTATD